MAVRPLLAVQGHGPGLGVELAAVEPLPPLRRIGKAESLMCKTGAPCGCGESGPPVGLWVAVVAAAGLVSAAASVLTTILVAVAVAGLCVAGVVVGYCVWRVRVLTRPARPTTTFVAGSLATSKQSALSVGGSPLALEAPQLQVLPASWETTARPASPPAPPAVTR